MTSPSFTVTIPGHVAGFVISLPRCIKSIGPVVSSTAMDAHTTMRNRSAADRKSAMNSGTALRLLTRGARTRERNIIPPIQAMAARMCRAVTANQKVDIGDHVPHVNECFNERSLTTAIAGSMPSLRSGYAHIQIEPIGAHALVIFIACHIRKRRIT